MKSIFNVKNSSLFMPLFLSLAKCPRVSRTLFRKGKVGIYNAYGSFHSWGGTAFECQEESATHERRYRWELGGCFKPMSPSFPRNRGRQSHGPEGNGSFRQSGKSFGGGRWRFHQRRESGGEILRQETRFPVSKYLRHIMQIKILLGDSTMESIRSSQQRQRCAVPKALVTNE